MINEYAVNLCGYKSKPKSFVNVGRKFNCQINFLIYFLCLKKRHKLSASTHFLVQRRYYMIIFIKKNTHQVSLVGAHDELCNMRETSNLGVWACCSLSQHQLQSFHMLCSIYCNIYLSAHSRTDRKIPVRILCKIYVANAIV